MEKIRNETIFKKVILIFFSILILFTLAFLIGPYLLPNDWYYVPESAILLALILAVLWMTVLIVILHYFSNYLKREVTGWRKGIITIVSLVLDILAVLVIGYHSFTYTLKLEEKVEQYDSHIALYVDNSFARVEFRYPHYMYEENWLLMRSPNEEELRNAIIKYGEPDMYYK